MFLSSKIKKIRAKMRIFTMVHETAPEDHLGINIFQKFFTEVISFSKETLQMQSESKIIVLRKK